MKLCTVVGARPQFIKASAVSRIVRGNPDVAEVLVHTGQHYDDNLSDVFFEQLHIPKPDYNLGIGSGRHGAQIGRMLEKIEQTLLDERPDWVMLYGDTNSTLAAALAAAKLRIPVAHVESGLRSFNPDVPEELNRKLTDHMADLLFAPTETAVQYLRQEGIAERKIHLVGDIMYDVALHYAEWAARENHILERLDAKPRAYVLSTIHRAENTDNPERLAAIFEGLASAAKEVPIIMPLHPRTRAALTHNGLLELAERHLKIIEPVGYLHMLSLEKNAQSFATDSGGMQKEAFYNRVPCVTFREETEWVELVDCGWNTLVPPFAADDVTAGVLASRNKVGTDVSLYGEGKAAETIVRLLTQA